MKFGLAAIISTTAFLMSFNVLGAHHDELASVDIGDIAIIAVPHSDGFNEMKKMLGRWEGKLTQNTGTVVDTSSDFKLVSSGNLITETLTEDGVEMLTTYSDNKDGDLVVKHYCALGTQPTFKLLTVANNTVAVTLDESQGGYHPEHHSYVNSMQWTVDAKNGASAIVDSTLYLEGELVKQQSVINRVN